MFLCPLCCLRKWCHYLQSLHCCWICSILRVSLVAQTIKNLPAMRDTQDWSLSWEDPWRKEWQHTLEFLAGEFHEQRSLTGYSPWSRKELDATEWVSMHVYILIFIPWQYYCYIWHYFSSKFKRFSNIFWLRKLF